MDKSILSKGNSEIIRKESMVCIQTLIIQALLQKLCGAVVKYDKEAEKLYNSICYQLLNLKLVTTVYDLPSFPPTSRQFNAVFKQLRDFITNLPSITSKITTEATLLIQSILELLCAVVETDPEKSVKFAYRISKRLYNLNLLDETYVMDQYEMIRSEFKRVVIKLLFAARNDEYPNNVRIEWPLEQIFRLDSKYYQEFQELGKIARGAFGKVFKARHKLDNTNYAVKKVTLQLTSVDKIMPNLTEVTTLASLNHVNIVKYKRGWVEFILTSFEAAISESSSNEEYLETSSEPKKTDTKTKSNETEGSDSVIFQYNSDEVVFEELKPLCKYTTPSNLPLMKLKYVLFIQMNLCTMTLTDFIERQNNKKIHLSVAVGVFKQLLSGLRYIHSRNIVHHDLKPSNIFMNEESKRKTIVKLGDFGLACQSQTDHTGSGGFGTPSYAAPEQLKGECTYKNDIYSLGIILTELLLPFASDMERVRTIEKLRKGELLEDIDSNFSKLIKRLINNSPKKRPNTSQIIDVINEMFDNKNNKLYNRIHKRDTRIKELTAELEEKDRIIEELKAENKLLILTRKNTQNDY